MLVSQIVNRALRLLGVIDVRQSPDAEDSSTAIEALNAMVTRWEANGLALGWANVDAVDDTLPLPDEAQEAVAYNLAVMLAPEYGMPASYSLLVERAQMGLSALRRDRAAECPLHIDSPLPRYASYNVYTDS